MQGVISDNCFQLKSRFNVDARAPSITLLNFPFKCKELWVHLAHEAYQITDMSTLVLSKLALVVLRDGICGSFHNKATINASALRCVLWQNLDEDSFDMLYKNYCWAAIPDPIWTTNVPYERKKNMLSSTDTNFMICIFDFERFSIESRFPFFLTHTVYGSWTKWAPTKQRQYTGTSRPCILTICSQVNEL